MSVQNIWGYATPNDLGDNTYDRGGRQCLCAKSQIHFTAWKMQHASVCAGVRTCASTRHSVRVHLSGTIRF